MAATHDAKPDSAGAHRPDLICQLCWENPVSAFFAPLNNRENADSVAIPLPDPPAAYIGDCSYVTSWAELKRGADAGCPWCRFMYWMRGEDSDSDGDDDEPSDSTAQLRLLVGNGLLLTDRSPRTTQAIYVNVNEEPRYAGYVYTDSDDLAAPYIVARSPILDVGSAQALSLAKACIDDCARNHPRCIAISDTLDPVLPTRVVDCTDPLHPRLVPTHGKHGRYLALSYVWGEAQPHRTTTSNLAAYLEGIDAARLPQTIRDAVHVTHALGFAFLWADSLCIVQDSDEDKRNEIGRMHHIYRGAYLTIIAASAQRVGEGFLHVRPAPVSDVVLPVLCPSVSAGSAATRRIGKIRLSPTHTHIDDDIEHYRHGWDPISARGWCMQEYFMSPRALLFTSETLQFRCQTTTQNVGGSSYDPVGEQRMPDAFFLPDPPPTQHGSKAWVAMYKAWLDLVEDYSRRAITDPADKLVACGAIAEGFRRVLRTDYLAGLWRATLLNDLLWFKPGAPCAGRAKAYRAPSWSWAAVDGEVWTGGDSSRLTTLGGAALAEVVRCEVALVDAALPYGQVTGGALVLRAALTPCVLQSGEGRNPCRVHLVPPTPGVDGTQGEELHEVGKQGMVLGWVYVDRESDMGIRNMWAVPLLQEGERLEGLIVALVDSEISGSAFSSPAEHPQRTVYRRVGRFDVFTVQELAPYWSGEQPLVEIEVL